MSQFQPLPSFPPRAAGGGGVAGVLLRLLGAVATAAALAIGAVLAVFTAVAVAVIAVCGAVIMMFAGLAMRTRRVAPVAADGVLEARKVDGAWVTYGWERQGR
jgi:hypothetical protein